MRAPAAEWLARLCFVFVGTLASPGTAPATMFELLFILMQVNARFNSSEVREQQMQDIREGRSGAVNLRPRASAAASKWVHLHSVVVQRFMSSGGRDAQLELARATLQMRPKVEQAWHAAPHPGDATCTAGKRACYARKLAHFWNLANVAQRMPRSWLHWGDANNPTRTTGIGADELKVYCHALQRYRAAAAQYEHAYNRAFEETGETSADMYVRPADDHVTDANGERYGFLRGELGAGGEDLQHLAQLLNLPGRAQDVRPPAQEQPLRYVNGARQVHLKVC